MSLWDRLRGGSGAEKAAARAAAFWSWFTSVAGDTRQMLGRGSSPELDAWVDELNRRTTAYHPLVRAMVRVSSEEPELVLTADGEEEGAEHVRELAESAPGVTGWTIRAFKPQTDDVASAICRVGKVAVTPADIEFAVIEMETPETGAVGLIVFFIRGLAGPDGADVEHASGQLLQVVLGEERALHWLAYCMMLDSEEREEKLAGFPRTPLSEIGGLFAAIDPEIGPVADA